MGTHTKRVHARCTGAVAARGCSVCVWDARLLHSPPQARPRGNWCIRRRGRRGWLLVWWRAFGRCEQLNEQSHRRRGDGGGLGRRRARACGRWGSSSRPYKRNQLNTDDAQKSTSS